VIGAFSFPLPIDWLLFRNSSVEPASIVSSAPCSIRKESRDIGKGVPFLQQSFPYRCRSFRLSAWQGLRPFACGLGNACIGVVKGGGSALCVLEDFTVPDHRIFAVPSKGNSSLDSRLSNGMQKTKSSVTVAENCCSGFGICIAGSSIGSGAGMSYVGSASASGCFSSDSFAL